MASTVNANAITAIVTIWPLRGSEQGVVLAAVLLLLHRLLLRGGGERLRVACALGLIRTQEAVLRTARCAALVARAVVMLVGRVLT